MSISIRDLFGAKSDLILSPYIDSLKPWEGWDTFLSCFNSLNRSCLYQSEIHGEGHIERVLLHAAFLAKDNHLSAEGMDLLFTACSYHDIGRIDDSLDDAHGERSARKLPYVTPLQNDSLHIVQAAIKAHSVNDTRMEDILTEFLVEDRSLGLTIAKMLKDADALDRVRVMDLDPKYLRFSSSLNYVEFAEKLYAYYMK